VPEHLDEIKKCVLNVCYSHVQCQQHLLEFYLCYFNSHC